MFTPSSLPDLTLGLWFLAFTISLLCLVAVVFELFFGKEPRSFWVRLAIRLGLLALAPLAVADCFTRLPAMQAGVELLGRSLILGLGVLAVYLLIPSRRKDGEGQRVSWGIIGLAVAATLWSSGRFYSTSTPVVDTIAEAQFESPEQYLSALPMIGVTDQGKAVTLYEYLPPKDLEDGIDLVPAQFKPRLIAAGPIDRQSNCHGWVFTGGKHTVRGAAVDRILSDNGYERVSEPQSGDLIIYRNAQGEPSHTGLVKATGKDGFVLIESKWGFYGRYMHEPAVQCYSEIYDYYRSERSGHLLNVSAPSEEGDTETGLDAVQLARTKNVRPPARTRLQAIMRKVTPA